MVVPNFSSQVAHRERSPQLSAGKPHGRGHPAAGWARDQTRGGCTRAPTLPLHPSAPSRIHTSLMRSECQLRATACWQALWARPPCHWQGPGSNPGRAHAPVLEPAASLTAAHVRATQPAADACLRPLLRTGLRQETRGSERHARMLRRQQRCSARLGARASRVAARARARGSKRAPERLSRVR